ncbi:MAG TPA: dienelactone hydrolase family protein [Kofleriaceae bacterium]|nr:dienelactone hydrolase family protein [Kofleriaceae bacterium]
MKRMTLAAIGGLFALVTLCRGSALAAVKTQEIEYKQGDTTMVGFLAYDDAVKGKRPGVIVVHEWWGHNQHARNQALRLAKAGYVAFSLDMYGKGKVTTHPADAKKFTEEATKDPKVVAARFNAAIDKLKAQPQVDSTKIAAIGYCFGGAIVLGMARSGADLDAVASFHGDLTPHSGKAAKGKVKARILVQTGGADPFIPKAQVDAFKEEMKAAGAKAEVITYPTAKHSFTNPDASKAGMKELAYDAAVDKKSWDQLMTFFKSVFGA